MPLSNNENAVGYLSYLGYRRPIIVDLGSPLRYKNGINIGILHTFRLQGTKQFIQDTLFRFKDLAIHATGNNPNSIKIIIRKIYKGSTPAQAFVDGSSRVLGSELFMDGLSNLADGIAEIYDLGNNIIDNDAASRKDRCLLSPQKTSTPARVKKKLQQTLTNKEQQRYQIDIVQLAPPHHYRVAHCYDTQRTTITFSELKKSLSSLETLGRPYSEDSHLSKLEKSAKRIDKINHDINIFKIALNRGNKPAKHQIKKLHQEKNRLIKKNPQLPIYHLQKDLQQHKSKKKLLGKKIEHKKKEKVNIKNKKTVLLCRKDHLNEKIHQAKSDQKQWLLYFYQTKAHTKASDPKLHQIKEEIDQHERRLKRLKHELKIININIRQNDRAKERCDNKISQLTLQQFDLAKKTSRLDKLLNASATRDNSHRQHAILHF